jgi:hypothetical protein
MKKLIITRPSKILPASMRVLFLSFLLSFLSVSVAHAQVSTAFDLMGLIYKIISATALLLWAVAIAVFFWGIVKFINNADDATAREEGKKFMLWSLIAFVVLVSLWGLVTFLQQSLGLPSSSVNYVDKSGAIIR